MLDLPPELNCQILQYLISEEQLDTYLAIIQIPELAELARCNFMHQLNLIRQLRLLASQLHHLLLTTVLLPAVLPRSSRQIEAFMENNLLCARNAVQIRSAEQAAAALVAYRVHLQDADTVLVQFAKMTRRNAIAWKFRHRDDELPDCGVESLSKVEHHRILRGILRLQLYEQIRLLYGPSRKLKPRIRALFSQWTCLEFDKARSVAEWMILEHKNLPRHYADGIQSLSKIVALHFEKRYETLCEESARSSSRSEPTR